MSSRLVIGDALLGALASSGRALVVPAIASGSACPSVRRRVSFHDLEEAL